MTTGLYALTDPGFSVLSASLVDADASAVFSMRATVQRWMDVEAALARAQARLGLISPEVGEALSRLTVNDIDLDRLWRETHNVGYPILPLVRQLDELVPEGVKGRVHLGATTQDIMDTGLALQMRDALNLLVRHIEALGDRLVGLVEKHRGTLMAARTHGQQAVPTTLGAKLATYLAEFARHLDRIEAARCRVAQISLSGAGGTSAAYGPEPGRLREMVSADLGLYVQHVPWHAARDGVAEFGFVAAAATGSAGRLAREIVDLSRTEIGELAEPAAHHRGASSAMPQKRNPITSEAVIGAALSTASMTSGLLRAMLVPQERAAGEWQSEWETIPRIAVLACAANRELTELIPNLVVNQERMAKNAAAEGGLLMAEAYMMRLAASAGREAAHDLVYKAVRVAREQEIDLYDSLSQDAALQGSVGGGKLTLGDHLGDASTVCERAIRSWRSRASHAKGEA